MKTGNIGNSQCLNNQYQNVVNTGKEENKPVDDFFKNPVDTYTPSAKGAADPALIDRLWKETHYAANAIRKLVASAIGKKDGTGQGFWAIRAGGLFKLNEADRAQAQQMISEDGFFGVKQTTERIMSFAKALVGEGASAEDIEKMRAAVQKGFDQVGNLFGGFNKLPDVTRDTYSSIMQSFDDWKAFAAAAA